MGGPLPVTKGTYQAFFPTVIDLILGFLVLIIKTFDNQKLLPTFCHLRLLVCPLCVIIIGEDSFVITSLQFGIDCCLQCAFQGLVPSFFLESIMLFSGRKKDSLYPVSRFRTTMELSPHPNDIRVRLVDMSVPWKTPIPIVKDTFLTELVIRDVRNRFFFDPLLQLIERLWF